MRAAMVRPSRSMPGKSPRRNEGSSMPLRNWRSDSVDRRRDRDGAHPADRGGRGASRSRSANMSPMRKDGSAGLEMCPRSHCSKLHSARLPEASDPTVLSWEPDAGEHFNVNLAEEIVWECQERHVTSRNVAELERRNLLPTPLPLTAGAVPGHRMALMWSSTCFSPASL